MPQLDHMVRGLVILHRTSIPHRVTIVCAVTVTSAADTINKGPEYQIIRSGASSHLDNH